MMKIVLFLTGLLVSAAAFAEGEIPYNVLVHDTAVVTDIRSEDGNVWIKLASPYLNDPVVVRISDQNRDYYRPRFTGNLDMVSTGFRGNGVWSDRVQTVAPYIEYWHNDRLVLQLEKK